MKWNKIVFYSVLVFILFLSTFSGLPFVFADGNVQAVQFASSGGNNLTTATCTLSSAVTAGDSLMITLDTEFINNPISSISDSLGNTWKAFVVALNSATTWAQSWEAQNIVTGGASDTITIIYVDSGGGSASFITTCAEFVGNLNFTQTGGQVTGSNSCNTCNLNLSSTTHKINYLSGYSASSQAPPFGGCAYNFLGGITPRSGSCTSQSVAGHAGQNILGFHAETDMSVSVVADSAVTVTCSPACAQNPAFVFAYYTSCISGVCSTVTQTITGFLVPNFVNGLTSFSWLYFLLIVLVPMGEIAGILTLERSAVIDRHAMIFIFLSLLLLDSIFGVMLNLVTVAMPFIFGILFGVYLWRGRG